jgi:hypothetical protein
VPNLAFNLFSVGSIVDIGLILVFDDKECLVYQGLDKIVGCGILEAKTGFYCNIIIDSKF